MSETYDLAVDPTRSTLDTAVRVAKLAEAARIDALFTADLLSFGAQGAIGSQEPLVFVSALSQVTSRIGLIATVSTTFHHPYNLARLFGTLDHVSNGRAAWNLVTSSIGEENFGPGDLPSPEERYARAAETLEVVNALWDSWEPGALTVGPDGKAVLHPERVHPIDHSGKFFSVAGPLNIPPLPQRRPVQFQAGQSEAGTALGARYAEVVFTSLPTLDIALDFTRKIRAQAEQLGRACRTAADLQLVPRHVRRHRGGGTAARAREARVDRLRRRPRPGGRHARRRGRSLGGPARLEAAGEPAAGHHVGQPPPRPGRHLHRLRATGLHTAGTRDRGPGHRALGRRRYARTASPTPSRNASGRASWTSSHSAASRTRASTTSSSTAC